MFSIFNKYILFGRNEKWKIGIRLIFLVFFLPQINFAQTDSTARKKDTIQKPKGRSPKVAALRAAVLPGWGQIYNKKYWKLPLVYGGAIGLGYGIYWNNAYYQYYRGVYQEAFLTNNPNNINLDQAALLRNEFRRSKEQLIIGSVVFYGLTVVDAIVDAHFSTYDVSDDLTLKIYPKIDFSPQGQAYFATTIQFGIRNKKKLQP
ncbi:MAG: DUF5683 domain-containing protein [Raineya sp.]|jgi:hypothetical protein|nr:DUF5683 domain-containing protein [Raineya sp.]